MIIMSILTETFGETPLVKAIDFFLTFREFEYSKTQVADEIGTSRTTIDKVWPRLVKNGIIAKTRSVGKAQLYKLNAKNPRVKSLMEMDIKISFYMATANPTIS